MKQLIKKSIFPVLVLIHIVCRFAYADLMIEQELPQATIESDCLQPIDSYINEGLLATAEEFE